MSFAGKLTLCSVTELMYKAEKQIKDHCSCVTAQNISWSRVCDQNFLEGDGECNIFFCHVIQSLLSSPITFLLTLKEPTPLLQHTHPVATLWEMYHHPFSCSDNLWFLLFSPISSLWVHLVGFLQNTSCMFSLLSNFFALLIQAIYACRPDSCSSLLNARSASSVLSTFNPTQSNQRDL